MPCLDDDPENRGWLHRAVQDKRMLAARRGVPEGPLHRIADAHLPKLMVALRYAFARARKALGPPSRTPKVDAAVTALRDALGEVLPRMLTKIMVEGGEQTAALKLRAMENFRVAKKQKAGVTISMQFEGASPRAAEWAREHAAWLIDNISQTTREKIQEAVASALEGEDWDEQWQRIANAVGDDDRATLIARTETMTAVHAGQREAWDQAVEEGLLSSDAKRVWIAVGDELTCPICEALDGEEADLNGTYPGGIDQPPAHPACRCSEGLS